MKKLLFLITLAFFTFGTYSPAKADSTISALSEVTSQPSSIDELVIVDKSDSTMGSTGTNKKIPVFRLSGISGISPFTDNSYSYGGVTLTPFHFGRTFTFSGATHYQIWYPNIDSGVTGRCIEFAKLGTGQLTIYARSGDFINQSSTYTLPETGVSQISIARLKPISGTSVVSEFEYNTYSGTTGTYLSQINQSLSTGVTPTFAGLTVNNLRVSSGVSVPELNSESGVTTPSSCLWQSSTTGASIFITGTSLYFSDSAGVDHALH